jgi:hypothetical protein
VFIRILPDGRRKEGGSMRSCTARRSTHAISISTFTFTLTLADATST